MPAANDDPVVETAEPAATPAADGAAAEEAVEEGGSEAMTIDLNVLLDRGWDYGESILGAVLVLIAGYLAAKIIGGWLQRRLDARESLDQHVKVLTTKAVRGLILIITLVAVLGKFGVQTASIVAVLGGLGLAVGLALQGSLSNVASGVLIMTIRPFKIGSVIKSGGEVYIIDDIGLIATRAHLPDGPKVTIPNNNLWGGEIISLSEAHDDLRRIDETYGIAYEDDIDKAFAIIAEVLDKDERCLKDPERLIAVTSLGDSSVNILCRVWVKREDWWPAKNDLIKAVKQAFDAQGITIPFPQRDVHLDGPVTAAS